MSFKKMSALLMVAMLAVGAFGCKKKEEASKEAAAPATAAAPAGNTVKIGFLGALTGDVAMFGKPTLEGMKMAAEEINAAGGVLGKKIEIVEADDRGDKQEGASVTQKLISRDGVQAIVGDPTTGITKVAAPIAQKAGVVLLSAGATGPGRSRAGFSSSVPSSNRRPTFSSPTRSSAGAAWRRRESRSTTCRATTVSTSASPASACWQRSSRPTLPACKPAQRSTCLSERAC